MGLPLPPLLEAFGCQKFGCENNYSHFCALTVDQSRVKIDDIRLIFGPKYKGKSYYFLPHNCV